MQYVNNIPVILSVLSAIITGLYGYSRGLPNSTVYKYMCVATLIFFLLGRLVRWTIRQTVEELGVEKENTYRMNVNDLLYYTEGNNEEQKQIEWEQEVAEGEKEREEVFKDDAPEDYVVDDEYEEEYHEYEEYETDGQEPLETPVRIQEETAGNADGLIT